MGDGDEAGAPDESRDSDDAGSPDGTDSPAPNDGAPPAEDADEGAAPAEDDDPRLFEERSLDDAAADEEPLDGEGEGDDADGDDGSGPPEHTAGVVTGEDDHDIAEAPSPDDGGATEGPREDQELPLTAHIEELLRRSVIVMVAVAVVSVVTFPFGEEIINVLWDSALPGVEARPRLYSPLELVITQVKVASLAGIVVALPVLVYQSYRFMRPGLYPHERRYYLAAVPTSLVLAFVGLVFGYFVVLPTIFTYFHSYSKDVAEIAFALGRTFDLILVLLGALAVVFQIPLFIMLALMMGLVTRQWLAQRRLIFWGSFLGISMIFSPDPTGMAPFLLTATMIVLFEGSLLLAKWTERGRERLAGV